MPLALVTGPANAGKAQLALRAVRTHAARGHDPMLVVPTDADQARYRRELAESGVVLGVRVERFQGLFEEVVRRARISAAPLGKLARERLLASLARERLLASLANEAGLAGSGADGYTADSPTGVVARGLARTLAEVVVELQGARVSPERLRSALSASHAPREETQLERLCDVYEEYREQLARMRRTDPELRVAHALDELRRKPSLWGSTPVVLYGFDSFTELQLDAIETLAAVVDASVTVSLPFEPGRRAFAGRAAAFHRLLPLAASHEQLPPRAAYYAPSSRAALHHLERSLFEDRVARVDAASLRVDPACPRVDPASLHTDPACARVDPGGAIRLLEGSSPRGELELVAGEIRALLDAGMCAEEIAIVHRAPDTIFEPLAEVLAEFGISMCALHARLRFAHTALGRGLLGMARCALDAQSATLGDLLAWMRAPGMLERTELADRLEADARRSGAGSAQQARELWEQAHWPLDRIDRLSAAAERGGEALLDALAAELERLFAGPRRGRGESLAPHERAEGHALAGGRRALGELRELARDAPAHAADLEELVQILEQLELPCSSRPAPGAVALVDPLSLRARRVRALFLCGMQEGVFPAPARPKPLLGHEERRRLALDGGLLLAHQPDAFDSERYLLYALCSRPEEQLVLSWHTAEEDGTPAARSLFVDDICDLFDESLLAHTQPESPAAGVAQPLLAETSTNGMSPITVTRGGERAAESSPIAVELAGRRTIEPLRDERVLAELRERAQWSASSLESFNACPVRWFVERVLRPQSVEPDPEPLSRGALAHAALKQTLERLRELSGSARITLESLPHAKRFLAEALAEHCERHPPSVAPERAPGARRRLQSELERYLEWAAEHDGGLEPTDLELEFDGLKVGEGVSLRGRIDRIDVSPQGDAVVYDYKARTAVPGARWVDDGALQIALYMRAAERLLERPVAGGFYQPLSGKDLRPRGVLDADAGLQLDCVRTDRREPDELRELIEQCERVALRAAEQAREGLLEPRPASCSPGGCRYPEICRCER